MPFSAATGATDAAYDGATAVMLTDAMAAAIHRMPVLGFCIGAPSVPSWTPVVPACVLLARERYQAARSRTIASSPY
jgi:hypothetical protein